MTDTEILALIDEAFGREPRPEYGEEEELTMAIALWANAQPEG